MIGGLGLLDLADPLLWILLGLAVVLVVPLTSPRARAVALASVYVGGILILLGADAAILAVAIAVVVNLTARKVQQAKPTWRSWLLATGVLGTLGLFLVHKLGGSGHLDGPAFGALEHGLAAIGFSYVALRVVDLLRTVAEGRQPPPGVIGAIQYLTPLHMLAAGPIQSYQDFAKQPAVPPPLAQRDGFEGLERIVRGLFKTYVLAGFLEDVSLTGFQAEGPYLLLELQLHYVWVYLDFSAYSDIAVGVGRLLGVATPENFDRPLAARNLTQLWERWHISLSLFLRRTLFVPLQVAGVRRYPTHGLWVASAALVITFGLCGLWHGLSPVFLLWGLYHGAGLAVVNAYRQLLARRLGRDGVRRYLESVPIRCVATVLTFEFVAVSLAFVLHPHLLEPLAFWL